MFSTQNAFNKKIPNSLPLSTAKLGAELMLLIRISFLHAFWIPAFKSGVINQIDFQVDS